jgi:hypothetical protein
MTTTAIMAMVVMMVMMVMMVMTAMAETKTSTATPQTRDLETTPP